MCFLRNHLEGSNRITEKTAQWVYCKLTYSSIWQACTALRDMPVAFVKEAAQKLFLQSSCYIFFYVTAGELKTDFLNRIIVVLPTIPYLDSDSTTNNTNSLVSWIRHKYYKDSNWTQWATKASGTVKSDFVIVNARSIRDQQTTLVCHCSQIRLWECKCWHHQKSSIHTLLQLNQTLVSWTLTPSEGSVLG